jgi:HAD superfamily phosphatase (TIGR01681 family)
MKVNPVVVYDLDNVIVNDRYVPCKIVCEHIKHAHANGSMLFIASHNLQASAVVAHIGMTRYFTEIISNRQPKTDMLEYIMDRYKIHPDRITFIDDQVVNVASVGGLGINSVLFSCELI